jgi:PadR family transcriptional regulator PadR
MAGSDLYTGTLELLILKAISWGPRHGYAVGRWIRETTSDVLSVQEGALYPALHRLERKGPSEPSGSLTAVRTPSATWRTRSPSTSRCERVS